MKARLYAPGPVEVPPLVLEATARVPHHRTAAFKEAMLQVREGLAKVACVPGEDVIILAGSGTSAFEAGLLACVPRGAKVIGLAAGKFGERWVKLARHYGYAVVEHAVAWGRDFDLSELAPLLRAHRDAYAVTVVHSETSTGVLHDVAAIAAAVREVLPEALVLVDAVTSLGVTELRPRDWGLDGMFAGSQKGLLTPPGLAFAWLSERAWASERDLNPSFYLDLRKERAQQRQGQTAYTPAVSLVMGLKVALAMLLEEGLERVWIRRERLSRAVLAAGEVVGCRIFAERVSPAVAALLAPDGLDAPAIVKGFAARGARIAGGQDHLKERLFRPSMMGYADAYDAVTVAAILEDVLRELGRPLPYGAAVGAAMRVLAEA
ncbi:MAG: alanine--glyoxylate aminotransferase family protein [Truepera sp.]|nr:alanine--glyoxylate aminotransferase family protein [Truepera sp.]